MKDSSGSRTKARVAFVGNYQYNCGSSNALLGYVRAVAALGYDIRVSEFGYIDDSIRASVPIANRYWQPDLLVLVFESYPFLSQNDINQICKCVPRSKRVVIDPDGKYLPTYFSSGDTNHPTSDSYQYWTSLYDTLSDTILQPFLGPTTTQRIQPFLYFGMSSEVSDSSQQPKDFDLIYVGNNWYQWLDICWLIKVIAPIRSCLKRMALVGQYWSDSVMSDYEEATYSDPDFLRQNQIEIYESVPYGQVEAAMSHGLLNPILIRPILNNLGFITPRMFETMVADTVPLIPAYFAHAFNLYGGEVAKLTLSNDPTHDILRILDDYETFRSLSRDIREKLRTQHS